MPCVYVGTCQFKEILATLPELPPHNWLITDLEYYDNQGWDGCEKWAEQGLFLTDEELRRDVNLRDMQIIWGVFSAIPAEFSKEDICKSPLPESENPRYMSSRIVPQHPLAFLELYADDGCFTLISSTDASLLEPLYRLSYKVHDEEADNTAAPYSGYHSQRSARCIAGGCQRSTVEGMARSVQRLRQCCR